MHAIPEYLTTAEVAAYLRLKERKVYDLVRQGEMPCVRITGKLLFPRQVIDLWVMNHLEGDQQSSTPVAPVLAGSHDPLLEWAARVGGGLALLCRGSIDGARRLLEGRVMLAGLHVLDPQSGAYNSPAMLGLGGMRDLVIIHWAVRQQGLLLPPGNPLGCAAWPTSRGRACALLTASRRRAPTPCSAPYCSGRWTMPSLRLTDHPSLSEDDLALAVREGLADAGLAIEAAARRHGLEFIPLHLEKFELAIRRRRNYFEPPVQRLLEFTRSDRMREQAQLMGGYDISALGAVAYNA
jgi:putative molybdopterin biosynthesis protein